MKDDHGAGSDDPQSIQVPCSTRGVLQGSDVLDWS
jgi:hypothetical protein